MTVCLCVCVFVCLCVCVFVSQCKFTYNGAPLGDFTYIYIQWSFPVSLLCVNLR